MAFLPAERLIILIIATLAFLDACLLLLKGIGIDFAGYASLVACGAFLFGLGQFYRHVRRNDRIAVTAIAAGLFVLFTIVGSIFNYLLLPSYFSQIDGTLMQLDGMLGYSWPGIVGWVARYPMVGLVLHVVYTSSLIQLLCVILVLGFSGRISRLQHFLLTGVIGALLAIMFWFFLPSIGPSAFYRLPRQVLEAMPLAVNPAYGAELGRVLRQGSTYLTPTNVLGLIAFPSFHMVMACMSVCFLMRIRFLFVPAAVLNTLMMPAILVHGGHHLVDLVGGGVTFAIAYALAGSLLEKATQARAKNATIRPAD
jgi:hypothetical protein